MVCNNCLNQFGNDTEALVISQAGVPVATICGNCVGNTTLAKITVSRPTGVRGVPFVYDQYQSMAADKKVTDSYIGP